MTHKLHINDIVVPKCQKLRGTDLANASTASIQGISEAAADALKTSLGISTVAELANHPSVIRAQAAVAVAATSSSPAQDAFYTNLNSSVQTSLGGSIQGTFQAANYPTGFPVCTFGATPNNYNLASLRALDALLAPNNDPLLQFESEEFNTYYNNILNQCFWQLSTADAATVNSPAVAQAQQLVWAAALQDGVPVAESQGWPAFISWVFTNYGQGLQQNNTGLSTAAINMNLVYPNTSEALTTYVNTQGPASAIQCAQSAGNQELAAAKSNTQIPTAANGGLQTATNTYYVGYTVPVWNALTAGLAALTNQVSIGCSASFASSTSTQVTINNISYSESLGWFSFTAHQSASSTNIETYTSASSTMTMSIVYQNVTSFGTAVTPIATNLATGWYDNNILTQIIQTWNNPNLTGFAIGSSTTFMPPTTFGEDKPFGHLKTWVISQPPTVSFTITDANVSAMSAAFAEGSAYQSIGFFSGSSGTQSNGYTVQSYQASGSTVTVTLAPVIATLVPATQYVAFVLGGVTSYPPNNT